MTITSPDTQTTSSSSPSSSTAAETTTASKGTTLTNGIIGGTVIGCLALLGVVLAGIFLFVRRQNAARAAAESETVVDTSPNSPESGLEYLDPSMELSKASAGLGNNYGELEGDEHLVHQLHEEPIKRDFERNVFELPGSLGKRMELDAISTATGTSHDNTDKTP